jgi:PRTRC genetic system protein E
MFVELMPLLGEQTVMITVGRLNQNSIRVNVIPSRKKEDENAALTTPLSFSGTPEELDREVGKSLISYVDENLRLQTALATAKAEMEAAAKAAREQAKAKTVQSTKKQEDSAAKETTSANTAPDEQNMTLFANPEEMMMRR